MLNILVQESSLYSTTRHERVDFLTVIRLYLLYQLEGRFKTSSELNTLLDLALYTLI